MVAIHEMDMATVSRASSDIDSEYDHSAPLYKDLKTRLSNASPASKDTCLTQRLHTPPTSDYYWPHLGFLQTPSASATKPHFQSG
jgi:hypothetical protein